MNTNYIDLLEEVKELNWEERRELVEVVKNGVNGSSVIYKVESSKGSDENFIISYGSFGDSYLLTRASAAAFLRDFETAFCNGEDAESYCSYRIALKED